MNRAYSNPALIVLLIYMWWFITTPYNSPRFEFLASIQFEKWLAGAFIVLTAICGDITRLFGRIALLVGLLFFWMVVCFICSEYQDMEGPLLWRETYWKKLVFFACLTVAIRTKDDLVYVVTGVAGIIFLYQLYTWKEFLQGGAFVYQQGMKRMAGVWSGPGYGAGNAWGNLGLFGIPFAITCIRLFSGRSLKALWLVFLVSSFLCIIFSGTRGALVAAVLYLAFVYRTKFVKFRYAFLILLGLLVGFPILPEAVQNRFLSLVVSKNEEEMSSSDIIAANSARGRLEGLLDGFAIANNSPLIGCGPAASSQAAFEHRQLGGDYGDGQRIQLHNLYGQVVAELGYPGLLLWTVLLATCVGILRMKVRTARMSDPEINRNLELIGNLLLGLAAVMTIYGIGSHSLYDFHWLFIFGMSNALSSIAETSCCRK